MHNDTLKGLICIWYHFVQEMTSNIYADYKDGTFQRSSKCFNKEYTHPQLIYYLVITHIANHIVFHCV